MGESAEFVLQWKTFKDNTNMYWQKLRNENCFSDVTLACDDKQMKAHKVVLSASSPVLKNILINNPHPNPLIYLKDVRYAELVSLLDFMYLGEVAILEEQLLDFLAAANELKIKGLTDETKRMINMMCSQDIERRPPRKRKEELSALCQYKEDNINGNKIEKDSMDFQDETENRIVQLNSDMVEHSSKVHNKEDECDELESMQIDSKQSVNIVHINEHIPDNATYIGQNASKSIETVDEEDNIIERKTDVNKVNLEKSKSGQLRPYENNLSETIKTNDKEDNIIISKSDTETNKGGLEETKLIQNNTNIDVDNGHRSKVNLSDHRIKKGTSYGLSNNDDKDTTVPSYQKKKCKLCNFTTDEASDLDLHKQISHQDRFFCNLCDYSTKNKVHLKNHVLGIHEGILKNCDKCDHKTSDKSNLYRHKRTMHGEGTIWYFCEDCDYSAADKTTLKRHKLSVHDGVRFFCGQCSFKATQKCKIIRHEKLKHVTSQRV